MYSSLSSLYYLFNLSPPPSPCVAVPDRHHVRLWEQCLFIPPPILFSFLFFPSCIHPTFFSLSCIQLFVLYVYRWSRSGYHLVIELDANWMTNHVTKVVCTSLREVLIHPASFHIHPSLLSISRCPRFRSLLAACTSLRAVYELLSAGRGTRRQPSGNSPNPKR